MYTCSEVVRLISSDEYLRAGRLRRLGIKMHLLLCKNCARYVKQLRMFAAAFRGGQAVDASEIERTKARILQHLSRKA